MRPRRMSGLASLALLTVLSASAPARAWTRTVVQSARATVEVERDATLYILLRLDVEVHAGWLHEMELVDLGPDVELDRYRPPYFRSEEGEVFRPEAELHEDGRIRLSFPRREAPRRGEYRVFIRYRTNADVRAVEVNGEPRARVVWSVPTWETGLHNVSVEIRAPKGTAVPDEMQDTSPGVELEIIERPKRTAVRWRRIHLPRMTAWPLAIDAPESSIVSPAVTPSAPAPNGFRPLDIPTERPVAWSLLVLALVALLKRRSMETQLGRQQLLLPASWPAVTTVAAMAVLGAQWFSPLHLAWGLPLVLLALHRPVKERAVAPDELDLLDGTTPLGGAVLIGCSASLFGLGQPTGALLLLPIFLTGTRYHLPPTRAEAIASLRSFASGLRLPADAPPMCFSWERSSEGAPRLRAHLSASRAGLLAVSFVGASSSIGFLRKRNVMLLVQTRAQSNADDLMRRRTKGVAELRDADGTILRLVEWGPDTIELLRVLAHQAPKPAKASRGTWLLREISEPGCKAA